MKLIEMRCPNCDAPLSVNADRDEAFCHHCSTTFLMEDAPKAESRNCPDAIGESAIEEEKPEKSPDEFSVEFEKAKSELPGTERFTGPIAATPKDEADEYPDKKETESEILKKVAAIEKAAAPSESPEGKAIKRPVAIAIAVAVALMVVIMVAVGTCSMNGLRGNTSSSVSGVSDHSTSSNASETGSSLSAAESSTSRMAQAVSMSAPTTQESSKSALPTSTSSSAAKDGFPCNLDSTATFSGVTIPIDSTWKDYSPAWDWRHYTFSYTAGSSKVEDVRVSISTFTGGDTKNAIAFMKDYADFGPIFLDYGEYTVKSRDERDGITYTRVEGVDSHYEESFRINPSSRHDKIRESHADDVVRCICLVGYAEDGTGFAVAVTLHGSADNDECLYSANKILDGVTFVPAECNIDSDDLWLYEVRH